MTLQAESIRTVVIEAVEAVLPVTFAYGAFAGQPLEAQQAMAVQTDIGSHWFDVQLVNEQVHASSPMSAKDPRRVMQLDVEIAMILNAISSDCDDAAQLLAEPGTLTETVAAAATEIVSGMMFGPGRVGTPVWSVREQNWDQQLIRSAITGSIVVVAEA